MELLVLCCGSRMAGCRRESIWANQQFVPDVDEPETRGDADRERDRA